MIGMLTWSSPENRRKRPQRITLAEQRILGVPFLCGEILRYPRTPEVLLRGRVRAAARQLGRSGVTRVVLPEAFAYGDLLEQRGVVPVSTVPLRRGLAADLVRAHLAARGITAGARLAVAGTRPSGELVRTVTELALSNRYLLLSLPYGAEPLAHQLRREYGVSLVLTSDRRQLEAAEVLLLFDPRPDLPEGGNSVLRLYDEEAPLPSLLLPPALEQALPAGCSRPQLLAALTEAGAVRWNQITVGR